MRIALDHIGFLGGDTRQMTETFRNLGFQVVGPAALSVGSAQSSEAVQTSAHVMFSDHYIELTSVNPCPSSHHLAPYRELGEAIRLLVLGTDDIENTAEDLNRKGQGTSEILAASRKLSYGTGQQARFRWLAMEPDPVPGILSGFVEHQDAAAVFDVTATAHLNTATGISALHCVGGEVPKAMRLGHGRKVDLKGDQRASSERFFNGLDIHIDDPDACERSLQAGSVVYKRSNDVLIVPASAACGAELRLGRF